MLPDETGGRQLLSALKIPATVRPVVDSCCWLLYYELRPVMDSCCHSYIICWDRWKTAATLNLAGPVVESRCSFHNNHDDKKCRQYKLLGIYLDEYLSLDYHVDTVCNKMNRSLYCIKQAKNNFSTHALKSLSFALVHTHLTYCPIIMRCTSKSNINRILKVQKKAIRIITNSN
jgi:hypothetical protein